MIIHLREKSLKMKCVICSLRPLRLENSIVMQTSNDSQGNPIKKVAQFRISDGLQIFLSRSLKDQPIWVEFKESQTIKHLAEALGIPHVEIQLVVSNGEIADLADIVADQDQIHIYAFQDIPEHASDVSTPEDQLAANFVLDNHLGKLAHYLRMLGFDCLYETNFSDPELAAISANQDRILLTRDRQLLMRKLVQRGYFVRSKQPYDQTVEVVDRFHLSGRISPFRRCLECNHELIAVEKSSIQHRLAPKTKRFFDEFHFCVCCDKIYWKGSHYEKMCQMIENISSKSRMMSNDE